MKIVFDLKKITTVAIVLLMGLSLGAMDHSVLVFHSPNFNGASLALNNDWSARSRFDYWNDAINSIIVPAGYEAQLYEHGGFQGEFLIVRGEWSSRQDRYWYNRISSIRIVLIERPYRGEGRGHQNGRGRGHDQHGHAQTPPRHVCSASCGASCPHRPLPEVTVFEHHGFQGTALRITGEWSAVYSNEFWNDRISSILLPRGYGVIVYEHANFRGHSLLIEGEWSPESARDFWNDQISSLRVVRL